jgi:hypothetical protein
MQRDCRLLCTEKFVRVHRRGLYDPYTRICSLNARFVAEASPERLALLLVHEAEHARRAAVGERLYRENASIVERVCVQAEVDFARRLPDGTAALAAASHRLAAVPDDYGTPAAAEYPRWFALFGRLVRCADPPGSQDAGK